MNIDPDTMAADAADDATRRARELYLDDRNRYGCAETAFVVLKEVDAPIVVRGRHWGNVRLAYAPTRA